MSSIWRERARPIIARIIKECGTEDMKKLRHRLRAAYPFGELSHHPYKIWLDEIQKQIHPPEPKIKPVDNRQEELF